MRTPFPPEQPLFKFYARCPQDMTQTQEETASPS
jgi:hypothetical protein